MMETGSSSLKCSGTKAHKQKINFKQIYEPKEMANTVAELVFIPAPVVGHINSIIEIAKLLVNRDQRLSITVLVIKPPPTSGYGSAMATYIETLAKKAMDRICFTELPHDATPPMLDSKSPMTSFNEFINSHCKYVRNVVADMINQPGSSRVAGFVIDMLCTSMIDVANEFNIPSYVFFTSSAAFLGFKLYVQKLCDDQNQDYVVELSNSDAMIQVPSFVKPVPTKVFPSMVRTREGVDIFVWSAQELRRAKAIMVNTFMELEAHAFESFSSDSSIPPVYTVGPLLNLEGGAGKPLDDDVMRWLDSQPPSSVVVLCFGSMGSFEKVQVEEIAHGLERSGHRFIWSLNRPPSDHQDLRVKLPEGFLERTAEIGKVIGMDPPVTMLSHHAVGGFVSHCEWDSLLGSLWFGVPSATWPLYAEQQMTAFEMVVELGLAVEIKLDYKMDLFNPKADIVVVTADEIESGIRRLMEDKTLRTKAEEMSRKSRAAATEGGSSYASVGGLIQDFMRNIS